MRLSLIFVLATAGTTAQAERLTYDCAYLTRCDSSGCDGLSANHQFRLDGVADSGGIITDGIVVPVQYRTSADMYHFLLVNDVGSELTSIALSGAAACSGQMAVEGPLAWYRQEGRCTARNN